MHSKRDLERLESKPGWALEAAVYHNKWDLSLVCLGYFQEAYFFYGGLRSCYSGSLSQSSTSCGRTARSYGQREMKSKADIGEKMLQGKVFPGARLSYGLKV